MNSPERFDVVIVGGGIAGASLAYFLAPQARVLLLEMEAQPGYHSTGRSAAMFITSYGPPQVRALSRASRAFFDQAPAGFCAQPILSARGALTLAQPGQEDLLAQRWQVLGALDTGARLLSPAQACALVPVLRPNQVVGAIHEPDASDIDVHALHQGYLRGMRQHGGQTVCHARVEAIARHGALWQVRAAARTWEAPVLVNAAGAWCDALAALAGARPQGLQPRRRSAFVFAPPPGLDCRAWPLCLGADESWYFKPDAGQLLGSPANADAVPAQDVQPEELDIAEGIHRIEAMTTLQIARPLRSWAGLRSFVGDGELVAGFDTDLPGFFWLAGQGGYGIQTSAAMGQASAALVCAQPLPPELLAWGVAAPLLAPQRLRA
ncbi:MAG: NAD(P)/FAD-dependent oxidoreductase [Rhodoferax sp.]